MSKRATKSQLFISLKKIVQVAIRENIIVDYSPIFIMCHFNKISIIAISGCA